MGRSPGDRLYGSQYTKAPIVSWRTQRPVATRATLKSLQDRKKSIEKIHKITNAIRFIAISKLAGAKRAMFANQPFSSHVQGTLRGLLLEANVSGTFVSPPLLKNKNTGNNAGDVTIIAIGSNKGLCGSFNDDIAARVKTRMEELQDEFLCEHSKGDEDCDLDSQPNIRVIGVGRRLKKAFRKKRVESYQIVPMNTKPDSDVAASVLEDVIQEFEEGSLGRVEIIYTCFTGITKQSPSIRTILPVSPNGIETDADEALELLTRAGDVYATISQLTPSEARNVSSSEFIMEPSLEDLLETTSRLYIISQMLRMMLESVVCEQLAARQAMQKATESAEELNVLVTRQYRRKRQSSITQEILEIVAGSNEMEESDTITMPGRFGDVPPSPLPRAPISPLGP